jgi:hypothetical protein
VTFFRTPSTTHPTEEIGAIETKAGGSTAEARTNPPFHVAVVSVSEPAGCEPINRTVSSASTGGATVEVIRIVAARNLCTIICARSNPSARTARRRPVQHRRFPRGPRRGVHHRRPHRRRTGDRAGDGFAMDGHFRAPGRDWPRTSAGGERRTTAAARRHRGPRRPDRRRLCERRRFSRRADAFHRPRDAATDVRSAGTQWAISTRTSASRTCVNTTRISCPIPENVSPSISQGLTAPRRPRRTVRLV